MQIPYVSTIDLPWVGKMSKIKSLSGFKSYILVIYFSKDTFNDAIKNIFLNWNFISNLRTYPSKIIKLVIGFNSKVWLWSLLSNCGFKDKQTDIKKHSCTKLFFQQHASLTRESPVHEESQEAASVSLVTVSVLCSYYHCHQCHHRHVIDLISVIKFKSCHDAVSNSNFSSHI